MNKRDFKIEKWASDSHHRQFAIERRNDSAIDEEARTVEVAFSSEEEYLRWFGYEILDHSPESVRLGRLEAGGAVLLDHAHEKLVGVIESVELSPDRVGRAVLRFGRGELAEQAFRDVVDGIRRWISVGYRVLNMVLEEEREDGEPSYRVNDWEPFEISFVAVPADATVGVGRSSETTHQDHEQETETMEKHEQEQERAATSAGAAPTPAPAAPAVNVEQVQADARSQELTRIRDIQHIGNEFGYKDLAEEHVGKNTSVDVFRQVVLAKMAEDRDNVGEIPEVGLSEREIDRYSVTRAMAALAHPDNHRLREAAAFEFEVSRAAQELSGRNSQGVMIPPDALKRDLNVGTSTAGGHTVETSLGGLIELLVNRSVIAQVGATMLTGLQGNVALPRQTSGATAYWVAEGNAPTESQAAFDQVPLSPKTIGAFTEYTRQLLLQSSLDVEAFVRMDLARSLALGIDLAALYGTGASNQPTGVSAQSGINTPTAFAAANPTFAEIVAMETAVAADNADEGTLAYVGRTSFRGHCKTTLKSAGVGGYIWESGDTVNGYRTGISNQVTEGDLFFGNWADLLIGMWGGLDLMVNPYALDTSGGVRITALQSMDLAVRHPVSFAYNNDGV